MISKKFLFDLLSTESAQTHFLKTGVQFMIKLEIIEEVPLFQEMDIEAQRTKHSNNNENQGKQSKNLLSLSLLKKSTKTKLLLLHSTSQINLIQKQRYQSIICGFQIVYRIDQKQFTINKY
ncbi:hypothetical protein TTHERM_000693108 (macronuclear) [Tetrahymena thermophila SB210]|uniref:Uncharacterized protein n=1 Tax=Tetrahymena thermophila (strain SB210) TaxID=312017 RepID=W7X705_TETTS|nr:hypothetical protein TTHERM_000693108 [Tetrahymena thermophila SB210]EWS72173.1 hypothetical protein TTHERM_000693108 [Tetrahymena thermophila SB210]|eukprot:XP_012655304.1 hypothetical protein TTHERM_000693108 [Tetrahymena thermophila SB210]